MSSVVYSAPIPKECTKTEKQTIKQILKKEHQELVEIVKGPSTDNKVVIEFTNKMYVLVEDYIEKIFVLGDGDWIELQDLDESLNSEQRLPAYVFNFDEGSDEQRIEIQPINGTNPWTIYYEDSFFDNSIQAMVYLNDDIMVAIGEDYVFYEDNLDRWWFEVDNCLDLVSSE
jgi:hypothetical protein